MKVVVFDLGGTLMEYAGMPDDWSVYYTKGFRSVSNTLGLELPEEEIIRSAAVLKSFNPRIQYREMEYPPAYIFEKCMENWRSKPDVNRCIEQFFKAMRLTPIIYDDSLPTLSRLRGAGVKTAVLTDLPTAMPDAVFRNGIIPLLGYIDFYVSSTGCGYRKPNPRGLLYITEHFGANISDLLFVGDEIKDGKAAENAGCRFVCIDRKVKNELANTKSIRTLEELFRFI